MSQAYRADNNDPLIKALDEHAKTLLAATAPIIAAFIGDDPDPEVDAVKSMNASCALVACQCVIRAAGSETGFEIASVVGALAAAFIGQGSPEHQPARRQALNAIIDRQLPRIADAQPFKRNG